ncbi:hypothetical protein [Geodermatophilus sp. SYSU D00079]
MILAAGLLVLIGLGTFVAGVVTDTTALYWVCVGACGLAAVLLVLRRVATPREAGQPGVRTPTVRGPASGGHRAAAGPGSGEQGRVRGPASGGHRTVDGPASGGQRTVDGPTSGGYRAVGRPADDDRREPAGPAAPGPRDDARAWAPVDDAPTGAHAAVPGGVRGPARDGEPAEEDVEVTDLLLVVDLDDEVLVVDERPRYHMAGCVHLTGQTTIPLPMVEAREDGFTPCGVCRPVRQLAEIERTRRRAARGY